MSGTAHSWDAEEAHELLFNFPQQLEASNKGATQKILDNYAGEVASRKQEVGGRK